jgi:hypothetical protein
MKMKFSNIGIVLLLTTLSYLKPILAQSRIDRPSFFQDGEEFIEREIQKLEQQQSSQEGNNPPMPLTIDNRELRWQKFIFREGEFSVWMPEGMQSEETVVLDTTAGEMAFKAFATHPKTYRFLAAYSDKINASAIQNPETFLASVRDSIVAKTNFQLTSDRAISWKQYSGKQLSLQGEEETITYRVYLIGQRVYLLAVGQKNTEKVSQEAINFFDSFRLLE